MTLPIIAATIGDPGGVGPEVCVKAVATGELDELCRPLLIGNIGAIRLAAATSGLDLDLVAVDDIDHLPSTGIAVLDPGNLSAGDWRVGEPSAASGAAAMRWLEIARELAEGGRVAGWVEAPLDSTSLRLAGAITELDDLQPPGTYVLRVGGHLRVVPITEHIPFRSIPDSVSVDAILTLVRLVGGAFRSWGIAAPRIGVAGLNPHAMGREDAERIAPAVAAARGEGWDCNGPVSPDAIFRQCMEGRYDVVVSMYHDQGQIAVKTAAFAGACSIFLGLPYIHLSIPHGSAMDIAGQGKAQHLSMLSGLKTAAALSSGQGFLS